MTFYKYCPSDRVGILETDLIRFTHPAALNDPLDLRPPLGALLTPTESADTLALLPKAVEGKIDGAYEQLPTETREMLSQEEFRMFALEVLASPEGKRFSRALVEAGLSQMNDFTPRFRDQLYSTLDRSIGVLSLSETWESAPMWAHYAEQGAGFVLALDEQHGFFSRKRSRRDEFFHLRQVIYVPRTEHRRTISDLARTAILLEKSESWSYEREWRMLLPLADAEVIVGEEADPIDLFRLPPSSIVGVIVGARGSAEFVSRLVGVKSKRPELAHVQLSRASFDYTTGQIARNTLSF